MRLARLAIGASVTAGVLLIGSGPMYQLGFLSLEAGYDGLRAAVVIGLMALPLAVVTVAAAVRQRSAPRLLAGLACALTASVAIAAPLLARARAEAAPPLHDITTDPANPPAFRVLRSLYEEAHIPLTRSGAVDALQRQAYPNIGPITLPSTREVAYEDVIETMADLDWPIADASAADGRVEATLRSPWFGFRDDVVVRLTPAGDSTRVDVRSVARDGQNDMGRNAEHVREFLDALSH